MEQAVWLAFGIIAVLLGFGIIVGLIVTNKDESRYAAFKDALEKLRVRCDFVCDSPLDTYLSADVELPSGLRLETAGPRICGNLNISDKYDDENHCVVCKCPVVMNQSFDLQSEMARRSFSTHRYSCYFERKEHEIAMECKG